jgi:hypothetical protein
VLLLKTKTNEQLDWLKAGRGFARITLASRSSVSPRNPSAKSYRNTRKSPSCRLEFNPLLGVREPEKIQMAVRVGRADRAYVAPRRDPDEFL